LLVLTCVQISRTNKCVS